jgi:hypothetical protein
VRLGPGDDQVVHAGAHLFDAVPTKAWTRQFLASDDHHLLFAVVDRRPIGFVTGVETTHPDGAPRCSYTSGSRSGTFTGPGD